MKFRTAICVTAFILAGCGTATTTASPSQPGSATDPAVRAKVATQAAKLNDKYPEMRDFQVSTGVQGDELVDSTIADACKPADPLAAAAVTMFLGATLQQHGHDVGGYMIDFNATRVAVAKIVDCSTAPTTTTGT